MHELSGHVSKYSEDFYLGMVILEYKHQYKDHILLEYTIGEGKDSEYAFVRLTYNITANAIVYIEYVQGYVKGIPRYENALET